MLRFSICENIIILKQLCSDFDGVYGSGKSSRSTFCSKAKIVKLNDSVALAKKKSLIMCSLFVP